MGFEAVHVGIDIGKMQDPTASVAVQVITDDLLPTRYVTQHLERLPLGMGYPDIADHIIGVLAAIAGMLAAQRAERLQVLRERVRQTGEQIRADGGIPAIDLRTFIDVTGVGRPVYDMVAGAIERDARTRHIDVRPITFVHGETYDRHTGRMGKAFLVSRLQVLLQERRLQLPPKHPEAQTIARELKDYEIHVDQNATDTYGAFKVGAHDDLVTGLGLAVLEDPATTGGRVRFFD
jgi:hypothetical protein